MKAIKIKKTAELLNAALSGTVPDDKTFSGVSTDSRLIHAGDCFFAIKGDNFDGHDFIAQAVNNGAACVVVDRNIQTTGPAVVLKVKDTIKALGDLARWYRQELNCKVIAITGSAGKTTTKQMTEHVLTKKFRCRCAKKSFNNAIGVPLTILGTDQNDEIIIAELGSNHPGEIKYLSNIAAPDVAVITNVYQAHLEGLKSIEGVIQEKASIAQGLRENGRLLINGDFPALTEYCKQKGFDFTTFGKTDKCDIVGTDFQVNENGGKLKIENVIVNVNLAGRANLENALAAWAICSRFGISIENFAEYIARTDTIEMRMKIEKLAAITIINDCYNANPASMQNALEYLARLGSKKNKRTVFICGTMAELGEQSEKLHKDLGSLASEKTGLLLAAGPYAPAVAQGAGHANKNDFSIHVFENTDALCDKLQEFIRHDDIILVKGSRTARLEKVIDKLKSSFS